MLVKIHRIIVAGLRTFVESILVLLTLRAAASKTVDLVHEATAAAAALALVSTIIVVVLVAAGEAADCVHQATSAAAARSLLSLVAEARVVVVVVVVEVVIVVIVIVIIVVVAAAPPYDFVEKIIHVCGLSFCGMRYGLLSGGSVTKKSCCDSVLQLSKLSVLWSALALMEG